MASKVVFLFCLQALLIQVSIGQVLPSYSGNSYVENKVIVNNANGLGANGIGVNGLDLNGLGANGLGVNGLGVNGLSLNSGLDIDSGIALANAANVANIGINSLSTGPGFVNLASISGGGVLPVTSYSPIAPGGLTVRSDNAIEGSVLVNGQLPFLSAVAFEGALNTDGAGAASCGCGNGDVGIVSEGYGPSFGGLGLGLGGVAPGLGGVRGLGGLRL